MYRQNITLPFLQVKDTPYTVFYCGEVAVGEQRYEALYLFGASVPPFQFKQEAGHFVVETLSVLLVNKPPRVRSPNVTAIITITIIAVLADFFI